MSQMCQMMLMWTKTTLTLVLVLITTARMAQCCHFLLLTQASFEMHKTKKYFPPDVDIAHVQHVLIKN